MNRLRPAILTAAAALALLTGCAKTASDDSLASSIKSGLYSDPATKQANISVAVKNGVVTLTGDVLSSDVALEAMKVANGTAGVRSVDDQLTINGVSAVNQVPTPPANGANAPQSANPYASQPNTAPPPPASPAPSAYPPAERHEEPVAVVIPAGERVSVRTIDAIDSATNQTGQTFRGSLNAPLVSRGRTVVPAGADVTLALAGARNSGRIAGRPVLEVRLVGVQFHGRRYPVESSVVSEVGGSRTKQTAVRTGIGAAAGAVIGAIAGGGKGAAIGSAAGGGAGFGSDFFTHGPRVRIPSEAVFAIHSAVAAHAGRTRRDPRPNRTALRLDGLKHACRKPEDCADQFQHSAHRDSNDPKWQQNKPNQRIQH